MGGDGRIVERRSEVRPSRTATMPLVLSLVLTSTLIAAACASDDETEPVVAGSRASDGLDCGDGPMSVAILEPPPDFAGHATAEEAVEALAASEAIDGQPKPADAGRWIIESETGVPVALVSVVPWTGGGWFAGELTTCGGLDAHEGPAGGAMAPTDVPFRLLADDLAVGEPWTARHLGSPEALVALAGDAVDVDDVDWDREVVFVFTLAEPSSCPIGELRTMEHSPTDRRLYPVVDEGDRSQDCTADANPHSIVVAIARHDLPQREFSIWVEGGEPAQGVAGGETRFAVGELTAPGPPPALGAAGELAIGETRIAYAVTTHCGLGALFRTIDGRQWQLSSSKPVGMDHVPGEWVPFVRGQEIDLEIERTADDELRVTAVGSGHGLTYIPAEEQFTCE